MSLTKLAISNMKHNAKKYAMYFFAMCFCIFTTYSFLVLMNSESVLNKVTDSVYYQTLFTGFGIAILIFTLFFLISSNNSFIRARKKELSTYALFGMQNAKISRLLFLETFIIGILALIVGIALGIFFSKLLAMILLKMLMSGFTGNVAFAVEPNAMLITVLIYFGIFIIMGLSGTRVINKFKLVDLFKADKVPEGKTNGSYVMLIISAILILGGYYFAISPNPITVLVLMIPIIIVVVLGTYLFYLGGFQKIMYFIKRNKKKYYKKSKLISISLLSHRTRTMATMMATIAILVAIGTTAIAFGYTLYQSAEQETFGRNSFDVYFYTDDETVVNDVYDVFKKHDVEATSKIVFQRYASNPNITGNIDDLFGDSNVMTYRESEFNRIVEVAKDSNEKVSVQRGDALILYPRYVTDLNAEHAKLQYQNTVLNGSLIPTTNGYNFGGASHTLILNDHDFDELQAAGEITVKIGDGGSEYWPFYGINYENALTSREVALELEETLSGRTGSHRISYTTYNEQLGVFGLLCFVGYFMCAVFILMTASMLYFKQITVATEERKQYLMLRKIGMDKDEENKVVARRLKPIFFFPLILGIIHSVFAMKGADTIIFSTYFSTQGDTFLSVLKTSLVMYVAYTLVYTLFYFITKAQYKQTIK